MLTGTNFEVLPPFQSYSTNLTWPEIKKAILRRMAFQEAIIELKFSL